MENITKKDIVASISKDTGLTQVDSKIFLETLFSVIQKTLLDGRNIEIRNFGRFKIKRTPERMARNPQSGEIFKVKPGYKPVFEPSRELKQKVNDGFLMRKSSPPVSSSTFHSFDTPTREMVAPPPTAGASDKQPPPSMG